MIGKISNLFFKLLNLFFVVTMMFGLSLLMISGIGMIVGVVKEMFK